MSNKLLLAGPPNSFAHNLVKALEKEEFKVDMAFTGKEAQFQVYENKYTSVILDLSLTNHSALEVLRYIKTNAPALKVVFTSDDQTIKDRNTSVEKLEKLGASDLIMKPYGNDKILKSLQGNIQYESWRDVKKAKALEKPVEEKLPDDTMTRIKIDEYLTGTDVIFDLHVRLASNHYLKIFQQGEVFERSRLEKYRDDKGVKYVYFKTKDRVIYINFVNDVISKVSQSSKVKSSVKITGVKNATHKFVEEIYTEGIRTDLIEEGDKICENVVKIVKKDNELHKTLKDFEEFDPTAYNHVFLVSFFGTIIANNLGWNNKKTINKVVMGGMFHDIGKIKLPKELQTIPIENMTEEQFRLYQTHPALGAEMMSRHSIIDETVRQIIMQHHELVNGEGFPMKLTGNKISPMAKIISLSNGFAEVMVKERLTPLKAVAKILSEKNTLVRYDSNFFRALIKSFVDPKKLDILK